LWWGYWGNQWEYNDNFVPVSLLKFEERIELAYFRTIVDQGRDCWAYDNSMVLSVWELLTLPLRRWKPKFCPVEPHEKAWAVAGVLSASFPLGDGRRHGNKILNNGQHVFTLKRNAQKGPEKSVRKEFSGRSSGLMFL
jgi:hypothetical protein